MFKIGFVGEIGKLQKSVDTERILVVVFAADLTHLFPLAKYQAKAKGRNPLHMKGAGYDWTTLSVAVSQMSGGTLIYKYGRMRPSYLAAPVAQRASQSHHGSRRAPTQRSAIKGNDHGDCCFMSIPGRLEIDTFRFRILSLPSQADW